MVFPGLYNEFTLVSTEPTTVPIAAVLTHVLHQLMYLLLYLRTYLPTTVPNVRTYYTYWCLLQYVRRTDKRANCFADARTYINIKKIGSAADRYLLHRHSVCTLHRCGRTIGLWTVRDFAVTGVPFLLFAVLVSS